MDIIFTIAFIGLISLLMSVALRRYVRLRDDVARLDRRTDSVFESASSDFMSLVGRINRVDDFARMTARDIEVVAQRTEAVAASTLASLMGQDDRIRDVKSSTMGYASACEQRVKAQLKDEEFSLSNALVRLNLLEEEIIPQLEGVITSTDELLAAALEHLKLDYEWQEAGSDGWVVTKRVTQRKAR